MFGRFGQATFQQATDLATQLTIPVLKLAVVKDKIVVQCRIFVLPGTATTSRVANPNECDVSLWDGASSTWQPAHGLAAGGWNLKAVANTGLDGWATVSTGVKDGWIRIVATHIASGAQSARAVQVVGNVPQTGTLTSQETINVGSRMPATFEQAQFAQSRHFGRRFSQNRGFRGYGG